MSNRLPHYKSIRVSEVTHAKLEQRAYDEDRTIAAVAEAILVAALPPLPVPVKRKAGKK